MSIEAARRILKELPIDAADAQTVARALLSMAEGRDSVAAGAGSFAGQHTQGPWRASPYSSVVGSIITAQPDPNENTVRIAGVGGNQSIDECRANASLIAAAPTMLAALEEIKRCNAHYNFGSKLLRIVLPAIARATGDASDEKAGLIQAGEASEPPPDIAGGR